MSEQSRNSQKQQQLASSGVVSSSAQPLEIRHFERQSTTGRQHRAHSSQCRRSRFNRLSRLSCSAPTEVETVETASQAGDSETSSDKQENQLMRRFNRLTKTRMKSVGHIPEFGQPNESRMSAKLQEDAGLEVSDDTVETNSIGKESTECSSSFQCMNDTEIRTFSSEQAGLSLPKLKTKLKLNQVQRAHLKERISDLEGNISTRTDSKDNNVHFCDFTIEVAVYTESPPADKTLSDENEDMQQTLTAKPNQGEGETESTDALQNLSDDQAKRQSREHSLSLTEAATAGSSSRENSAPSKESKNEAKRCSKVSKNETDEAGDDSCQETKDADSPTTSLQKLIQQYENRSNSQEKIAKTKKSTATEEKNRSLVSESAYCSVERHQSLKRKSGQGLERLRSRDQGSEKILGAEHQRAADEQPDKKRADNDGKRDENRSSKHSDHDDNDDADEKQRRNSRDSIQKQSDTRSRASKESQKADEQSQSGRRSKSDSDNDAVEEPRRATRESVRKSVEAQRRASIESRRSDDRSSKHSGDERNEEVKEPREEAVRYSEQGVEESQKADEQSQSGRRSKSDSDNDAVEEPRLTIGLAKHSGDERNEEVEKLRKGDKDNEEFEEPLKADEDNKEVEEPRKGDEDNEEVEEPRKTSRESAEKPSDAQSRASKESFKSDRRSRSSKRSQDEGNDEDKQPRRASQESLEKSADAKSKSSKGSRKSEDRSSKHSDDQDNEGFDEKTHQTSQDPHKSSDDDDNENVGEECRKISGESGKETVDAQSSVSKGSRSSKRSNDEEDIEDRSRTASKSLINEDDKQKKRLSKGSSDSIKGANDGGTEAIKKSRRSSLESARKSTEDNDDVDETQRENLQESAITPSAEQDRASKEQRKSKDQLRSSKRSNDDEEDIEEVHRRPSRESVKEPADSQSRTSKESRKSENRSSLAKPPNEDDDDVEEPFRASRESVKDEAETERTSRESRKSEDRFSNEDNDDTNEKQRRNLREANRKSVDAQSRVSRESRKSEEQSRSSRRSKSDDKDAVEKPLRASRESSEPITSAAEQTYSSSDIVVEAEVQAAILDNDQERTPKVKSDESAVDSTPTLVQSQQTDSMHLINDGLTATTDENSCRTELTSFTKADAQLNSTNPSDVEDVSPSVNIRSTEAQIGSLQIASRSLSETDESRKTTRMSTGSSPDSLTDAKENLLNPGDKIDSNGSMKQVNEEDLPERKFVGTVKPSVITVDGPSSSLVGMSLEEEGPQESEATKKESKRSSQKSRASKELNGSRSSQKSSGGADAFESKQRESLRKNSDKSSVAEEPPTLDESNHESQVGWPDENHESIMSRPSFIELDGPSSSRIFNEMDQKQILEMQQQADSMQESNEDENDDDDAALNGNEEEPQSKTEVPERKSSETPSFAQNEGPSKNTMTKPSIITADGPSTSLAGSGSETTEDGNNEASKAKRLSQSSGSSSKSATEAELEHKMQQIDAQLTSRGQDGQDEKESLRNEESLSQDQAGTVSEKEERKSDCSVAIASTDDVLKQSREADRKRASLASRKASQKSEDPEETALSAEMRDKRSSLPERGICSSVITADGPSKSLAGSVQDIDDNRSRDLSFNGLNVERSSKASVSQSEGRQSKRGSSIVSQTDRKRDSETQDHPKVPPEVPINQTGTFNGVVYMCESTTSELVSKKEQKSAPKEESDDDNESADRCQDDAKEEALAEDDRESNDGKNEAASKRSQSSKKQSSVQDEGEENPESHDRRDSEKEEEDAAEADFNDDPMKPHEGGDPLNIPSRLEPAAEGRVSQQVGGISSSDTAGPASAQTLDPNELQEQDSSDLCAEVEMPSKLNTDGGKQKGKNKTEQRPSTASLPSSGRIRQASGQRTSEIRLSLAENGRVSSDRKSDVDNKAKGGSVSGTQRDQRVESLIGRFREAAQECANVRLDREALRRELEATKFDLRRATAEAQERRTELSMARREVELRDERLRQQAAVQVRTEKEVGNLRSQLSELRRQLDSAENSCQAELARNQRYRAQLVSLEAQLDSRIHELAAVTNALIEKRGSEEDLLARVQQLQRALTSSEETVARLTGQLAAEQRRVREILLTEKSLLQQQQQQLSRSRRYSSLNSPSQLSPREPTDNAASRPNADAAPRQQRASANKSELVSRLEQRIAEMDARIERLTAEARDRMSRHQQQRHVQPRRSSRNQSQQQQQQQPNSNKDSAGSNARKSQTDGQQRHQMHVLTAADCDEGALSSLEHRAAQLESSNRLLVQDVQSL
uniref:FH2 domain-containing protein n=1 Tax=Macrostomum lignano TaxID=282301 RepID=A0A1I8I0D4_9PLAT